MGENRRVGGQLLKEGFGIREAASRPCTRLRPAWCFSGTRECTSPGPRPFALMEVGSTHPSFQQLLQQALMPILPTGSGFQGVLWQLYRGEQSRAHPLMDKGGHS